MASSSDQPPPETPVMTDADFEKALENYTTEDSPEQVNELLSKRLIKLEWFELAI